MFPFRFLVATAFVFCIPLAACTHTKPAKKLAVRDIVTSSEPIIPDQSPPQFSTHFGTGETVLYSYVVLENSETMTGSFPVRLRWFYPNDFRPPMAQHTVTMEPGQEIAQFEIHNESGITQGPYMLIPAIGSNESSLTETGSWRFFVGMTEEEATTFVKDEEAYRRKRDEEMKKREEEEKARIEREGTGGLLGPEDSGIGNQDVGEELGIGEQGMGEDEIVGDAEPEPQLESLPPALIGE